MREAIAVHFFFNKNIGRFQISTFKILTKRTSLVLNNRAQVVNFRGRGFMLPLVPVGNCYM